MGNSWDKTREYSIVCDVSDKHVLVCHHRKYESRRDIKKTVKRFNKSLSVDCYPVPYCIGFHKECYNSESGGCHTCTLLNQMQYKIPCIQCGMFLNTEFNCDGDWDGICQKHHKGIRNCYENNCRVQK